MTLLARARLDEKWAWALPAALVASACIVAGGLVAAATAPVPSEAGSWTAAYLVLVGGVAQFGLVFGQALLAESAPSSRRSAAEFGCWNLGNAAVIIGTLVDLPPLVDVGGVLLICALVLALLAVRGARAGRPLRAFQLLVTIVAVSIPVGLVLAALGSGSG